MNGCEEAKENYMDAEKRPKSALEETLASNEAAEERTQQEQEQEQIQGQENLSLDDLLKTPPVLDAKKFFEILSESESNNEPDTQRQECQNRIRAARGMGGRRNGVCREHTDDVERLSLETQLRKAAAKASADGGGQTPARNANNLFNGRVDVLADLAGRLGDLAPLAGPGGMYGFENPTITLTHKVRSGDLDTMPMDDYNLVLERIEEIAKLWEGQQSMQGTQLARNAILYAVLHDGLLRARAVLRAQEIITECCVVLGEHNYRPV